MGTPEQQKSKNEHSGSGVVAGVPRNGFLSKFKPSKFIVIAAVLLIGIGSTGLALYLKQHNESKKDENRHDIEALIKDSQQSLRNNDYDRALLSATKAFDSATTTDDKLAAFDSLENAYGEKSQPEATLTLAKQFYANTNKSDRYYPGVLNKLASAHLGVLEISKAIEYQNELIGLYENEAMYHFPYSKEDAISHRDFYKQTFDKQGDGKKNTNFDYLKASE